MTYLMRDRIYVQEVLFLILTLFTSIPQTNAVVGERVHQITVPVSGADTFCSIGLTFDGAFLYYDRCNDRNIYKIHPISGALEHIFDTGIAEHPNCLAFDPTRNGLWIGTQSCSNAGMPIYFWDFDDDSVTQAFTIPFTLINPATSSSFLNSCFCDGLAFDTNNLADPSDDELWFSDDVNRNIGVFRTDGTFSRGLDATSVHPSLNTCSGLAIGGPNLYLANDGGGDVFRADKSKEPLTFVDQFTSGDTRQEDMECDPITFTPREVMWIRTTPQGGAFPDVITAFEIEPATCSLMQITPPAVQKSKFRQLAETVGFELVATIFFSQAVALACDGLGGAGLCSVTLWTILDSVGLAIYAGQVALIVRDPPDPEFSEIFLPRDYPPPIIQPGPDLTSEVVRLANSTLANLTNLYELVEAWRVTLERYQGAINAGDEDAAEVQLSTLESYILRSFPLATSSADSMRQLLTILEPIVGPVPLTQEQLETGLADLTTNGIPPLAREILSSLGLTDHRIDEILTNLLNQNIAAPSNLAMALTNAINDLDVFSRITACFQGVDCDDGNPCTIDSCDLENGCLHTFIPGCIASIPVDIDIKPGSDPNSINPRSSGVISVAILTTEDFDATTVDPLSVAFGPNGARETHNRGHIEDVDGDGDDDMLLHFRTEETGIQCGDTSVSLTGETFDGQEIEGSDSIITVGCQ